MRMAENAPDLLAAVDKKHHSSRNVAEPRGNPLAWLAAALVSGALAGACGAHPLGLRRTTLWDWIFWIALAVATLATACWAAWRSMQRPPAGPPPELDDMADLLRRMRGGEEPIEALSRFHEGACGVLVTPLREIFHDFRQQRAAVAELENELRQRVANRTDALERALSSMRYQATRDALTGLFNRRFLDQYLPQAVQRHIKEKWDLSLLMVDVDNFKLLNDGLGHAAGDDLLRSIGQIIRSSVRGEDVSFRVGGDEFIILLPNADPGVAGGIAERLISLVDALAKTLRVPAPPRLSIGVSSLTLSQATTPEELLEHADRALYVVKDARKASRPGRNEAATAR